VIYANRARSTVAELSVSGDGDTVRRYAERLLRLAHSNRIRDQRRHNYYDAIDHVSIHRVTPDRSARFTRISASPLSLFLSH